MEVYKALCLDAAARHPWGKDVGRLRLVPVVVYNGARKWTAPLDAPPVWTGAGQAAPRPSYRMVDLDALLEYDPAGADVAGALVGLERARTLGEFRAEAATLARLLSQPGDVAMAQAFSSWIAELMNKCGLRVAEPGDDPTTDGRRADDRRDDEALDARVVAAGQERGLAAGQKRRLGRAESPSSATGGAQVRTGSGGGHGPVARAQWQTPARLRAVGEAIVDCDAADELLNRVR